MANLRWLCEETHAHLHVDLIAGLPGEDVDSFPRGFDQLVALRPHEIQFGILKRLRGTPIIRHTQAFGMVFDPAPPYQILANDAIDFNMIHRLVRFARYWDLVANSGRFSDRLPDILGDARFFRFLALSDWLYANTDATHRISPERLGRLLNAWLATPSVGCADNQEGQEAGSQETTDDDGAPSACEKNTMSATRRQQRHQAAVPSVVTRHTSISDRASSLSEDKGQVRARSKIISA